MTSLFLPAVYFDSLIMTVNSAINALEDLRRGPAHGPCIGLDTTLEQFIRLTTTAPVATAAKPVQLALCKGHRPRSR